jgi:hypothetical protein
MREPAIYLQAIRMNINSKNQEGLITKKVMEFHLNLTIHTLLIAATCHLAALNFPSQFEIKRLCCVLSRKLRIYAARQQQQGAPLLIRH